MEWKQNEWIGSWINFERLIEGKESAMERCWQEAELLAGKMPMFQGGAQAFWRKACNTVTPENPVKLGGWEIKPLEEGMEVKWFGVAGEDLGTYDYEIESILERGLEGKENFLFYAKDAKADAPFKYLLAMEPMPEKNAVKEGGLLSHLHFQFASSKEQLLQEGKLCRPMWYATMCAEGSLLEYCNIVRALHRLPVWDKLPEE